ncbi:hypothetical protein SFUMM280S_06799 [Streptomyces fumanus]
MADAPGKVTFVGAGPGAADLLTFRAARASGRGRRGDLGGQPVQAEVLAHARTDAEVLDSATMSLEDVVAVYQRAHRDGLKVARIHSGDPRCGAAPGAARPVRGDRRGDGDRAGGVVVLGRGRAGRAGLAVPRSRSR